MSKKEFIREVQSALEADYGIALSLDKIRSVISAYANTVNNQLVNGQEVRIDGVGLLEIRQFKATVARNLKTGSPMSVPATHRVRFRAVPTLKKAVKSLPVVAV